MLFSQVEAQARTLKLDERGASTSDEILIGVSAELRESQKPDIQKTVGFK